MVMIKWVYLNPKALNHKNMASLIALALKIKKIELTIWGSDALGPKYG